MGGSRSFVNNHGGKDLKLCVEKYSLQVWHTMTKISDNGRQFNNQEFRSFYSGLRIKNQFSLPRHPQANGKMIVMNRTLLKIIKVRLEGAKGVWPKELPNVL